MIEFTTPWLYWKWTEEWAEDDSLDAVCDDGAGGDGGDGGNGSGGGGGGGEDDHEYEEVIT